MLSRLHHRTLAWAVALGLAASPVCATDLDAALQAAQAADPTLASARASRDAAAENETIARARLLPQVTLQSSSQHLDQTTSNLLGQHSRFNGRSVSTQLSVRQALYRPRDWAGLQVGELQAAQGEAREVSALSDLWLRTSQAWVDALAAQAQQHIADGLVDSVAHAAAQEARRLTLGDGTRDAAAEAAAQLTQARAQQTEARLDAQTKLDALRRLTGLDRLELTLRHLPDPDRLPLGLDDEAAALEQVLERNADLLAARLTEQLAERRLGQAGADHWPTVDAIASATSAESDSTNTLGLHYRNTQLGVQVVIPLWAGGGVSAAQRQAIATQAAASADREALAQRLTTQFSADWNTITALRARLAAARELVRAAAEARKAAELGIRGGLRTWGDVSSAAQQQARRQGDVLGLSANLLKTQAHLLSLLPVTEPVWPQWSAKASRLSQDVDNPR